MSATCCIACPLDGTICEVKFMLPSHDGRWVFFSSCEECVRRGVQKSTYMLMEVSNEDMARFIMYTPMRRWLSSIVVETPKH